MTLITKKLKYKRSNVEYEINLYDSTGDVGSNYIGLKVDGQTVYAKLGDVGDVDASHLRISKGGVTYAVLTVALEELPSGFVAIFDSSCPDGWTQESSFNGYFLRAALSYNAAPQGDVDHTHTFSPGSNNTADSDISYDKIDTNNDAPLATPGHYHVFNAPNTTSSTKSPLPRYMNVVFCRKD
ncbi:MAG: hypothetical protein GY950_10525 [bacterium]|nr:hypothetical protein [bacterium]